MSKQHSRSATATRSFAFLPEGALRARIGTIGLGAIVALLALFNLLAGAA